ncbi:signal transduction histidine kinase [Dimargaris cristalligena]|uniref:Signal transduction histidine kinase n=1 Tax=Dimargaris cristalligena TaxID=215637 RepID=A0A4P9ZN52_9FUNG|nr:signal transduction histidine kinase [Dimargaris cristalligena]|eukprot:RKP33962.1 signal transduction histidine kinase [Dimargaris cristalligena]
MSSGTTLTASGAAVSPHTGGEEAPYDLEMNAEAIINMPTFEQLLEMDDDEEDSFDFIRSLVDTFHEQAMSTFAEMDENLAAQDLEALSRLGHFLKGSSASVGLRRVPLTCGRIQNYGHLKDDSGEADITRPEALDRIAKAIAQLKVEYNEADLFFRTFFAADGVLDDHAAERTPAV